MSFLLYASAAVLFSLSILIFAMIPYAFAMARRAEEQAKLYYVSNLINAWKYDQVIKNNKMVPPPPGPTKPKNQGPKLYPLK